MTIKVDILAPVADRHINLLTPEALDFLGLLACTFEDRRQALLRKRVQRQRELDAGIYPTFLPHTRHVRAADWQVAPIPADLQDRRVEITGPPERKMVINALNSGANVFMADFEDSHAPTWHGTLDGQINLRDAVRKTITFDHPSKNKQYKLNDTTATLMVRPRGWHLDEKHIRACGRPMSASLFDFGLYFFHNAQTLIENGTAPYFYLPKLESHLEARLWDDVFTLAQETLGISHGTIRATVLIENILVAYEMDEVLYELRDHSAGLNCGRWDYIFSAIRHFRHHPEFVFPDRAQVTMTTPFMRAYSWLLIQTCHKRGVHAMGGMAAQIPIKNDPIANENALAKVRADKEREAKDGHDGTWVAHPGLVPIAKAAFDEVMPEANQIHRKRKDLRIEAGDLLPKSAGIITTNGLITNIDVAIQYIASWLAGNGCVPIYNLMEDAATAEISRAQLWQWVKHSTAKLDDGRLITADLYEEMVPLAWERIQNGKSPVNGTHEKAKQLLNQLVLEDEFTDFLTLPAYQQL